MKSEREGDPMVRENRYLDVVNYQAQKAILNPNLPGEKKDEILDFAIETIGQIAERKAAYYGKHGEGRKNRRKILQAKFESHTVYKSK